MKLYPLHVNAKIISDVFNLFKKNIESLTLDGDVICLNINGENIHLVYNTSNKCLNIMFPNLGEGYTVDTRYSHVDEQYHECYNLLISRIKQRISEIQRTEDEKIKTKIARYFYDVFG